MGTQDSKHTDCLHSRSVHPPLFFPLCWHTLPFFFIMPWYKKSWEVVKTCHFSPFFFPLKYPRIWSLLYSCCTAIITSLLCPPWIRFIFFLDLMLSSSWVYSLFFLNLSSNYFLESVLGGKNSDPLISLNIFILPCHRIDGLDEYGPFRTLTNI